MSVDAAGIVRLEQCQEERAHQSRRDCVQTTDALSYAIGAECRQLLAVILYGAGTEAASLPVDEKGGDLLLDGAVRK